MGIKLLNIYIGILIIAIIVGAVGLYFAFNDVITPQELIQQNEQESQNSEKTEITLVKKSKEIITLVWNTLTGNTKKIIIYRFSAEHPQWVEWKTLTLEQQKTNSPDFIDILLGTTGTSSNYLYYIETVSATGTITFTSPVQEAQNPQITPETNTTSTPIIPQTAPTNTPTQPTTPPSNNTSPASATTTPSPTAIYYTPNGTPIIQTSQQYPTEPFWVVHADTGIEIGWQNMPLGTTKVTIYRKKTTAETGAVLLTKGHISAIGINFIRIVDDSTQSPWYYTLEAKDSLGTTLGSFGPVYLEAK